MRYNREEPFRFSFIENIPVFFSITEVNENVVNTPEGYAQLVDLSPNGLKLKSSLNIHIKGQDHVLVSVRFSINDNGYRINGKMVWRKEQQEGFFYGIQLFSDEQVQNELIKDLKQYAAKKNH